MMNQQSLKQSDNIIGYKLVNNNGQSLVRYVFKTFFEALRYAENTCMDNSEISAVYSEDFDDPSHIIYY